eukprot:1104126-Prorocentrum_minimum.AAC.2
MRVRRCKTPQTCSPIVPDNEARHNTRPATRQRRLGKHLHERDNSRMLSMLINVQSYERFQRLIFHKLDAPHTARPNREGPPPLSFFPSVTQNKQKSGLSNPNP